MRITCMALFLALSGVSATAQWVLQKSPTTADLRAVSAVDANVAWASGAAGTVLRTQNGGATWEICAAPKGAATAAIAGVQAFDANAAVIMTSGKGARSRLLKTTDGCRTWKQVFSNPDVTGEFVALRRVTGQQLFLLGQPVDGKFAVFTSRDGGDSWFATDDPGLNATPGESAFSPSNSDLTAAMVFLFFGSYGDAGPTVFSTYPKCANGGSTGSCPMAWRQVPLTDGKGMQIAAIGSHITMTMSGGISAHLVAVGGDPTTRGGFAAFSGDGGKTWHISKTPPTGYRSGVDHDESLGEWIAVGANDVDVSKDDGATWAPLAANKDAKDSMQDWTAMSLPFAVGLHGRVGRFGSGAE